MASSIFIRSLVVFLVFGILIESTAGWRRRRFRIRFRVRRVVNAVTKPLCVAGAGWACTSVAGPIAGAGCRAYAGRKCRRRRRDATSTEDEVVGEFVPFPQSFEDYTSGETIDFESFVAGVENGMPQLLHHYQAVGEAFDTADLNDDAVLDREEFALGSWIIDEGDEALAELRKSLNNEG